ncbi:MAG: YihY/virulence factor BrkB family protein, partial [Thiogranum sp.]
AMIGCTYVLIPFRRPGWKEIWPGLVTASVLIELGKKVFVYYVDNISSMDAIYGSISSIIALMLWLYFFGRVLLYGADVNFIYGSLRKENARTEDTTILVRETDTAINSPD